MVVLMAIVIVYAVLGENSILSLLMEKGVAKLLSTEYRWKMLLNTSLVRDTAIGNPMASHDNLLPSWFP